jgi:hypothetical protein
MGVEQPGLVLLSAAFALLGLFLLTKRPVVWRAIYAFPIVFLLIMGLLWLDSREDFGFLMIFALTIGGAIPWAREHFGPSESWSIHNASRAQVIAALERALRTHGIPFDWHRNRLRLPTVGIGGSSLGVGRWFGNIGVDVSAADRDERRIVAETVFSLLRDELSKLPRPIIPASGVFFLAWGALMLVGATQLPKLFP